MLINRTLVLSSLLCLLALVPVHATEAPHAYVELPDAPTIAVDWSKGDAQAVTLHGNRVVTFSNGQKGGKYLLIVRQDTIGSRTLAWPSSVTWPGGPPQASVLTTTANKRDYLVFFYDGVSYDVLTLSQNH